MRRLPRVISPITPLLTRDSVQVALLSVELWPDQVVVRLAGLPDDALSQHAKAYSEELEEWGSRPEPDAGHRPPSQPAEAIYEFEVGLADDVGTDYRLTGSARGGTGHLFRAEWLFAPGAPETAHELHIVAAMGQPDAATAVVRLPN